MIPLFILYEDANTLVLNKPAGVSVHGDGKTQEETIADAISAEYPGLLNVGEPLSIEYKGLMLEISKPGIVHRLDKDTSGVLLVAKNQETFLFFKKQFQEHTIKKIYNAFVYGWIKNDSGTINTPIGRSAGNIRKWGTKNPRGKIREAITEYRVQNRFGDRPYEGKGSTEEGTYSFLELETKTGRTHQIRVHLQSINHPIVSDSLYAPNRTPALGFGRCALHARSLGFILPDNKEVTIEAPYPTDFQAAIDKYVS